MPLALEVASVALAMARRTTRLSFDPACSFRIRPLPPHRRPHERAVWAPRPRLRHCLPRPSLAWRLQQCQATRSRTRAPPPRRCAVRALRRCPRGARRRRRSPARSVRARSCRRAAVPPRPLWHRARGLVPAAPVSAAAAQCDRSPGRRLQRRRRVCSTRAWPPGARPVCRSRCARRPSMAGDSADGCVCTSHRILTGVHISSLAKWARLSDLDRLARKKKI